MQNRANNFYSRQPWSAYAVHLTTLSPPAFLGDILLVWLCHKATGSWGESLHDQSMTMLYLWIFTSKWIKLLGHYLRYPVDVLLLPVSIIFGYFHGAIKMYAVMTLNVVCSIFFSFFLLSFILHFLFLFLFYLFLFFLSAYTPSVSKRSPSPMTTQHHSALIIVSSRLQLCLPTIFLFSRLFQIAQLSAFLIWSFACFFHISKSWADFEFFLLQTTWGSRDGADDYDAERMKKRTDADRMKQPYYPQYLIKWGFRISKVHFLFAFSLGDWFMSLGCTGNRGQHLAHWLGPLYHSWRNAVTTPTCSLILDLPWLYPFFFSQTFYPVQAVSPSCREWYELRSGNAPLQRQSLMRRLFARFSFLCTWLPIKNKKVFRDLFSPSLLVNYKSMGGCRLFAIVDSLRFSLLFSFDSPGFFVRAFCPFFLDAKVVFWTFSFFSLLLSKLQIISNWVEYILFVQEDKEQSPNYLGEQCVLS